MPEERRLVTVLFADIVGSTSLGESMDPEDLRRELSRFYAIATDVVTAHGGSLEKFIGDAALAIFGIPQAHDDDPRRALAAAIELRDRLQRDEWFGQHAPMRMGLSTGEVVASAERTGGDFIITGDAVNVAARLQQHADPWQILATDRTVRAAREAFAFDEAISLDLRGKSNPVLVRALLGPATANRSRIPIVGREADLAQLALVARRSFSERRPFLVSLIAPAGTGKTRLLEEFLDGLPSIEEDARTAIAQCLPYGQRLTYWPMRALLLALLDLPDRATASEIRSGAQAWLHDAGADEPERTAELLAVTIGASEAEGMDRAALFAAWRSTLELAAAQRPLVLIIEDLHWSSDSLLDLVEFILQPSASAPMLMIALTRPELLDRRPAWGGGRRNHVSLTLEPLGEESIGRLVEHMLGRPAAEIASIVVRRADGNPFYAGEIVRSIVERTTALDDSASVAAAAATLPDTVQATVLARLDLLQPVERRVLQLGAVYGRGFRPAGVAALEPAISGTVDGAVEGLVDRDLVRRAGAGNLVFRHILIREVAYQTLPRSERARLHAAAGRWLEGEAVGREDEFAELIAFHLREAAVLRASVGELDPEANAAAVGWLRRAAETAIAASATIEAGRHLEAAIDLAPQSEQPELYARLGDAFASGDSAAASYAMALRLGREQGRSPDFLLRVIAEQLMVICRWYAAVARQPTEAELERLVAEGEGLLPQASDDGTRAAYLIARAFVPFWLNNAGQRPATEDDYAQADANLTAGLEIAERLDDVRLISAGFDASITSMTRVTPQKAREVSLRRLEFGDRLDMQERLDAIYMVGWASALLGDFDRARMSSDQALQLIQPGQNPGFGVGSAAWAAYGAFLQGRWDDLVASVELGRQQWLDADRPAAGYAIHGFLAGTEAARRRGDDARLARWREVADMIIGHFERSHPTAALRALTTMDLEGVADLVGHPERYTERLHVLELAMTVCADRLLPVSADALDSMIETSHAAGIVITEAQGLRLRGLLRSDPEDLRAAMELYRAMRSAPNIGRLQTEIGMLTGDDAMLEDGLGALEALGELEQPARIRQRAAAGADPTPS
jgi:class 3 adenylate cyclase/tetratricopeptide (TPR) repeat protein